MNLSMFEDWLCSSSTSEGTSFQEDVGEGTKKDSSCRTNQSENETGTSKSMSFTTGRNKGILSKVKNLGSSSTREPRRNISSKKYWDQGVNDLQNSRHDSNLNTIQSWLRRFGKPEILPKLENSLEQVKRNKISQEDHEELSKSIDKELQKLSITFHPDRAGDTEWQAALNAIREVLKTLAEVFLENIFIDYKYEYFSKLDVRVLVNENERNKTIQTIFYKISVFSETKRLNIIGEIRKFLTESEKCVESFLKYRESDFLKFRDYALYHLRKNIEGYKKLERECNLLIEECSNEDDSMRTVVQNMVDHSSREWSILKKLEQSAKSSFQGNFEIFPVQKDMDEYYILPFVDYVNVLSMCNLLLQPRKSRFLSSLSKVENFGTDDERGNFIHAYFLAYDIYLGNKKETQERHLFKQELRETLETIFRKVLQTDYSVDVYREGKSNRAEMYEKLLSVKNILKDLQDKEKAFGERVRQYEMERNEFPESVVNCRQNEEESFKTDVKKGKKEREGDSTKLTPTLEGEENQYKIKRKRSYESDLNCRLDEIKCLNVDVINREKEIDEDLIKLNFTLEGDENRCKMEMKKSGESVLNCIQDEEKSLEKRDEDSEKLTSPLEGEENQNEMKTKKFCELVLNCRQDEEENMTKREKESEGYLSDLNSLPEGEKFHEKCEDETEALIESYVVHDEVGVECLNQCKMETKKSGESVLNCIQDEEKSLEKREKEKAFGERVRQYEMERNELHESVVNCRQNEEENFKADVKKGEKERERDSMKFTLTFEGEENQYKSQEKESEGYVSDLNSLSEGEKLHEKCEDESEAIIKSYVVVDEVGVDWLNQSDL